MKVSLPIDLQISEILSKLKSAGNLVLSASPGAGKTTRVPPALLELTDKQVWVLEPRRMAAVAAAHRIAEEQNWSIGKEIGYQVRFENKSSSETRVLFLTEALLARKILDDPELKNVGIIVLDEFHERSLHVDLAFGLLKELQSLARPDLKIVVMSATLDAQALSRALGDAPRVDVPGLLFEIQIEKQKKSQLLRTDHVWIERISESIQEHLRKHPKGHDVLVFLPGVSEIRRTQEFLKSWCEQNHIQLLPLHGHLDLKEQLAVLQKSNRRKVILSTNIAESSVTIDGVDAVIDSGLARTVRLHPQTQIEQLITTRISKASAKQRAGRSARQYPGQVVQMWNSMDEISMPDFEKAEIHRLDLMQTVLFLKDWGVTNLKEFSWFEAPNSEALQNAEKNLQALGALDSQNQITDHGRELRKLPLDPRLAQIVGVAKKLGHPSLGCEIAALLQEGLDHEAGIYDCDLTPLLESNLGPQWRRSFQQIQALLHLDHPRLEAKLTGQALAAQVSEILLLSFPDRLARRREPGSRRALLRGGRGVELDEKSQVRQSDFFVAVEVKELDGKNETRVAKAVPVSMKLLEKYFKAEFQKNKVLRYSEKEQNFFVDEFESLWKLNLSQIRTRAAKPEEIGDLLPQVLLDNWELLLQKNDSFRAWWHRWQYFEKQTESSDQTNEFSFSSELLQKIVEEFCYGERRLEDLWTKNLSLFFEQKMASVILEKFQTSCPSHIALPSGKSAEIIYPIDRTPYLEVRLQELFGLAESPRILNGKLNLQLSLLGPNFRPVQVTSDLSSFWKNTYPEVKKELKTRYPRHYWPDDPLVAEAKIHTRPRTPRN